MTREEAIEILQGAIKKPNTKDGYLGQAIDMAIQALSQVTEVRKLILQAERAGVQLDYGAYKFMNALEKVVGEKQIGEFEQEPCEWGRMTFDAKTGTSVFEFSDGTIKQVKQAELEQCDDAISRETVIDTLQYAWEANKDIQESIVEIKALPSVTPSRRKGHWKKIETPQGYCDKYVCSVCGYEIDTSQDEIDEHNYCPNCGCRMVEPQESEE